MNIKRLTIISIILCLNSWAEIQLPRIICDDMVLQQRMKNTLWGWSEAGSEVSVVASWGAKANGKADASGKWKIFLDTPSHGVDHSLEITSGGDSVTIKNVAIGEVWLCAGQSNMGWSLGNSFGGEAEAAKANHPNYRIFKSASEHWYEPRDIQRDRLSQWKPCTPESAAETSAVSYFFGAKLHQELDVPVGIIVQAYAGTPIEGWMPKDIQMNDPRTVAGMKQMDEMSQKLTKRGITRDGEMKKYEKELADYNAKVDAGETMKNKVKALAPPRLTKPSNMGHQYPSHIFNCMIYPIRPYGIKGAIWYQGERNSKDAAQAMNYRKQLAQLIGYYRSSWHELSGGNTNKAFPFYFTQLPSWNPAQEKPVEGVEAVWAINREMMRLVSHEVPNTGVAVSIDTGDAIQLHPKNKRPIGIRHAYLALKQTYGKPIVDYGPRFRKQVVSGNTVTLEFDSVGGGMVPAKAGKLNAFAIAGADQVWHWADAKIVGATVVVSSPKVSKPVAVRYAWAMNPSERNLLYNKEGIPASPFRTDDWALFDPKAEPVIVNKPAHPEGFVKATQDWERPKMNQ